MKKTSFLHALFIALFTTIFAQNDSTKNNVYGLFFSLPIECPFIDVRDLNQQLDKHGFPEANYATANIGFSLQFYKNRLITSFSFNRKTKRNDNSSFVSEVEYRSTSLNFGYSLVKSRWYSIYPFVGFKGVGLNYLYREKAADTSSFGKYLNTNLRYAEVTNSRAHLDVGIGLSHQWFYLVNFRMGYLLPLERVRWNSNNNQTTLPNSPNITYTYYFTLTLGFGNMASDNDHRQHNARL